jgi:SOS-response transcriptional repressor LexA
MPIDHRAKLATIKRFDQLIAYLRDEMGWPIENGSAFEDLTFEYLPEELGIDSKTAAKIQEIKRLRPLSPKQPWGIFFVKFEPKRLPVVALRRILGQVALKKRASANTAERAAWAADDLLFVSNYGEGDERQISFAHFARAQDGHDLPTLKVLGWDNRDTALHLDAVARELSEHLAWPDDDRDAEAWRTRWRGAFTLRHGEVVTTSKELSIRLAKLAGDIRDRIKSALAIETDRGPLTNLLKAFQTSLVHDLDADGFADMYAQTIAYGLLSARIADPSKKTADDFAAHMRTNPFLRELMETFLKVGGRKGKAGGQGKNDGIDFDELGVSEVVELLDDANMEAVVRDFGDRNPHEDPVIHFYELFLKEYDARKRMQRGVFYTPRPVVSYIVRSVDELLRTQFGLEDGLADTTSWGEMARRHKDLKIPEGSAPDQAFVQILDPATGTGTFLVEVIDIIHKTMITKWKAQGHGEKKIAALWNDYVPKNLLPRLHAYELLMAPYAIAHLKVGLKLYETGYRFDSDERARVYLTNALEPAGDKQITLDFLPALAHEAQAVNDVKRHQRFTVVIGNPPYSGISSNMTPWIDGLLKGATPDGTSTASYYHVNGQPLGERKLWLQDDYVKFIRLSQHCLSSTGVGIHGYISNHGYLDNPTFRGMRWSLMDAFDNIRVLDLHGNLKKKEAPPGGGKDMNVFDIQQGVGIGLFVRCCSHHASATVRHADLWGDRDFKYRWLVDHSVGITDWQAMPITEPFFLFEPFDQSEAGDYNDWPAINDVMPVNVTGIVTARDDFVIDLDPAALRQRMADLRDSSLSDHAIRQKYFAGKGAKKYPPGDSRGWKLPKARQRLRDDSRWDERCAPILYRPFDIRDIYYVPWMVDWPRTEAMPHMLAGENFSLSFHKRDEVSLPYSYFLTTRQITEHGLMSSKTTNYQAPLYLYPGLGKSDGELFQTWPDGKGGRRPNLDPGFVESIAHVTGLKFVSDGRGDLKKSFGPEDVLAYIYAVFHSPKYRRRFEPMLKLDFPRVPSPGAAEPFASLPQLGYELLALHMLESPKLAKPITEFIGGRSPEVEKVSWSKNIVWIDKGQTTGFKGVREDVWNFHIGGYQVCEKWLKDRKGRTLSQDDIAHYQKIVVALAETIRLMKEIDEVIEQHGGWPGAFQTGEAKAATAKVIPFRPRTVEPKPEERYVACVPLVPLKAAAGAFSDPQDIQQKGWDDGFEWVAVNSRHRLRKGMFVAQVVGKSMEPAIPDGAFCLFRAPVEGTRQGKTVLVQLRDATDAETGQRYTVKRYESEKAAKDDSWYHERITLKPINPDFEPIVLTGQDHGELQVIAELVEVLGSEA